MYKILNRQRAQYWFWYVRKELILCELKAETDLDRQELLTTLLVEPTLEEVYGKEQIANQILLQSGQESLYSIFYEDTDKFKAGKRPSSANLPKLLDQHIPDSFLAYQEGPSGLFQIIEANTIVEAVYVIARHLLKILEDNQSLYNGDIELEKLTNYLIERQHLGIFGGSFQLLIAIENIINYLFPNNEWGKFVSVLTVTRTAVQKLDVKELFHPKYFDLEAMAPIVIGYGFIRARFFEETHYLSKVCYEEKYLTFLNKVFLINEDFWIFESFKNELESAEFFMFNPSENTKANIAKIQQSAIKNIFQKAHYCIKTNPMTGLCSAIEQGIQRLT